MKKKIFKIIFFILILIFLKVLFNIFLNKFIIKKYNEGKYLEKQAHLLVYVNYFQKYIAYYNYGNILYKNENIFAKLLQKK